MTFELNIFCLHVLIHFNTTGVISKVKVVGRSNGNRIKNPFFGRGCTLGRDRHRGPFSCVRVVSEFDEFDDAGVSTRGR